MGCYGVIATRNNCQTITHLALCRPCSIIMICLIVFFFIQTPKLQSHLCIENAPCFFLCACSVHTHPVHFDDYTASAHRWAFRPIPAIRVMHFSYLTRLWFVAHALLVDYVNPLPPEHLNSIIDERRTSERAAKMKNAFRRFMFTLAFALALWWILKYKIDRTTL